MKTIPQDDQQINLDQDKSSATPTRPCDITFSLVKQFKDEVRKLPRSILTATESKAVLTLADKVTVRRKNLPAESGCGTWSISFTALADASGCSDRTAKRAISTGKRLGIVRQIWRGHNFNGDPNKAKASCYTIELPSIAVELDPVAWENECARRRPKVARGSVSNDPHGSVRMNLPQASRKCQERPYGSVSADLLNNHNNPVGASQTGRIAPPVRYTPPESVVADSLSSRCEGENLQHRDSSPASSSMDGFPGSSLSDVSARSEPRTFEVDGDHLDASPPSPSEPEYIEWDNTPDDGETDYPPSNIPDAASPGEDSPLDPIIDELELPFDVMLDLVDRFRTLEAERPDDGFVVIEQLCLVDEAIESIFGEDAPELWEAEDVFGAVNRLMHAQSEEPPPISFDQFQAQPDNSEVIHAYASH